MHGAWCVVRGGRRQGGQGRDGPEVQQLNSATGSLGVDPTLLKRPRWVGGDHAPHRPHACLFIHDTVCYASVNTRGLRDQTL